MTPRAIYLLRDERLRRMGAKVRGGRREETGRRLSDLPRP